MVGHRILCLHAVPYELWLLDCFHILEAFIKFAFKILNSVCETMFFPKPYLRHRALLQAQYLRLPSSPAYWVLTWSEMVFRMLITHSPSNDSGKLMWEYFYYPNVCRWENWILEARDGRSCRQPQVCLSQSQPTISITRCCSRSHLSTKRAESFLDFSRPVSGPAGTWFSVLWLVLPSMHIFSFHSHQPQISRLHQRRLCPQTCRRWHSYFQSLNLQLSILVLLLDTHSFLTPSH